jgi:hypothetical protein
MGRGQSAKPIARVLPAHPLATSATQHRSGAPRCSDQTEVFLQIRPGIQRAVAEKSMTDVRAPSPSAPKPTPVFPAPSGSTPERSAGRAAASAFLHPEETNRAALHRLGIARASSLTGRDCLMANSNGTFVSTPDDHGDRLDRPYRWTRAGTAAIANPLLRRYQTVPPVRRVLRDGAARPAHHPKACYLNEKQP